MYAALQSSPSAPSTVHPVFVDLVLVSLGLWLRRDGKRAAAAFPRIEVCRV